MPTQPEPEPAEIDVEWSRELDRRIAAYRAGKTTARSFDESIQFLRNALAEHRKRRAKS